MSIRGRVCASFVLISAAVSLGAFAPSAFATSYPPPAGWGTISGTITDAATGAPMAGVTVGGASSNGTTSAGAATTDSNGNYSLNEPGGASYYVTATYSDKSYSQESYPGVPLQKDATTVNVTAGQTTSGINFPLTKVFGAISGTVTNALTGAPAAGAFVAVSPVSLTYPNQLQAPVAVFYAHTGPDGTYSIPVAAGTWKVEFGGGPGGYWTQAYNSQSSFDAANTVTVTPGQATTAGAAIEPRPTISGRVTNPLTGAPVANTTVDVLGANGGGEATTDSQGDYTIQPSGWANSTSSTNTYTVRFDKSFDGYDTTYYGGDYPSTATRLVLKPGQSATGINGSLSPGGKLVGVVTDTSGVALNAIDLRVLDPSGNLVTEGQTCCETINGRTIPGTPGTFEIDGLAPGVPYKLEVAYQDHTWATQYYNETTSLGAADALTAGNGQTITIDPVLWRIGGQPPAAAPATPAKISTALTQALNVSGPAAKITAILTAGGYPTAMTAPGPGTEQLVWDYLPPGAHIARASKPVVVASATKRVTRGGATTVKLTLTRQGKALLKKAKRIKLVAVGSFTPSHGKKTSKQRAFTLAR